MRKRSDIVTILPAPTTAQSWRSVLVDLALIGAVMTLAIKNVNSTQVWMVLSGMVSARFAYAVRKPSEGGDSGVSAPRMRAVLPPETPPRPPSSLPRETFARVSLAVLGAVLYLMMIR